jgi:hypothetical protein
MDPVKMFNEKLLDFIEDLRPVLSTIPEYTLMSSSVKWLGRFEPAKNSQIFHQYLVVPFGDHIANEDEEFFLESGSVSLGGTGVSDGMGLLSLLRSVWRSKLVDTDKKAIWMHLRVLVALSGRCRAASGSPGQ